MCTRRSATKEAVHSGTDRRRQDNLHDLPGGEGSRGKKRQTGFFLSDGKNDHKDSSERNVLNPGRKRTLL